MAKFEQLGRGIVKRREQRHVGLFIDGTGLDRATRRIARKVDMASLVRGVTSGTPPAVARYYTLIPYEDDSRQRAFLDAVARAGMQVIVKRLPPKGITRQVSVDPEMSADIIAFAMGHDRFSSLSEYQVEQMNGRVHEASNGESAPRPGFRAPGMFPAGSSQLRMRGIAPKAMHSGDQKSPATTEDLAATSASPEPLSAETKPSIEPPQEAGPGPTPGKSPIQRVVTVVCPGRDLSYAIALSKELGADTVSADFGQFNTGDVLKSAAKWIDLSDSETIWRDA